MPTKPQLLSDEALAKIEARHKLAARAFQPYKEVADSLSDIPALIQTVRAAWATIEKLDIVGLHDARLLDAIRAWSKCPDGYPLDEHVNNIATENAALREQLARREREAEWQKSTIEQLTAGVTGCAERLAQVEKELTDTRQKLTRRCSHPNTYPLTATTRRCHDCGVEILL